MGVAALNPSYGILRSDRLSAAIPINFQPSVGSSGILARVDRTRSPSLCRGRFQIADKESRGALPRLIRVAAKTQHAAEHALAGRDIDDAEAQAAYQGADLIDRTNQHPISMNQPGQVTLAAVAPVEWLSGPGFVDLATDRDWIDDRVEPMRSQLPREIERQRCQSIFELLGSRRCLAGSIRYLERKHEQGRYVRSSTWKSSQAEQSRLSI